MENIKILVLGSGFVGKPLAEYLKADVSTKRLHEINEEDLAPYDVVINTAAKTNIDWCEVNRGEAFDTNVTQAVRIAKMVRGQYVFFSSGCIFNSSEGEVNYEGEIPNPQCFYAYTKAVAEQLLYEVKPSTLIIRPRLIVSEKSHPKNTIDKLLRYDKIITCQESVTVLEDLIKRFPDILYSARVQNMVVRNIFNEGTISPSEMMDIFGHSHTKISKDELDLLTKGKARRSSTILGTYYESGMPEIHSRILEIKQNWDGKKE
jgi:dTDP-4-dehydrorhamnose reductase